MSTPLRCLRPCLRPHSLAASGTASSSYLRFYNAVRAYSAEQALSEPRIRTSGALAKDGHGLNTHPRITSEDRVISFHTFKERYKDLQREQTHQVEVVVRGMLSDGTEDNFASAYTIKEEYWVFD